MTQNFLLSTGKYTHKREHLVEMVISEKWGKKRDQKRKRTKEKIFRQSGNSKSCFNKFVVIVMAASKERVHLGMASTWADWLEPSITRISIVDFWISLLLSITWTWSKHLIRILWGCQSLQWIVMADVFPSLGIIQDLIYPEDYSGLCCSFHLENSQAKGILCDL